MSQMVATWMSQSAFIEEFRASACWHKENLEILRMLESPEDGVLQVLFKTSREARKRRDSLEKARSRGHARFSKSSRKGNVLYLWPQEMHDTCTAEGAPLGLMD